MTTKTSKKKKRNVQDATLKNTRPLKRRIAGLEHAVKLLWLWCGSIEATIHDVTIHEVAKMKARGRK